MVDVDEYVDGITDALAPVNWTNPGVPEYVSNAVTAVLVVYGFFA